MNRHFFNIPDYLYRTSLTMVVLYIASVNLLQGNVVTTTADSGPGSLRQLIAEASSGDTITFDLSLDGVTITLMGNQMDVSGVLDLDASSLPYGLAIDADWQSRVFAIANDSVINLKGLTIRNGTASQGGAIRNSGNLTLIDCRLSGNGSSAGGAIYNSGSLDVERCAFTNNGVGEDGEGGAIYNSGDLVISQTELRNNNTDEFGVGGAIYTRGELTLLNSTLDSNFAWEAVAGAIFQGGGTVVIQNSTITRHGDDEGAIVSYGDLSVINSTLAANMNAAISHHNGTLRVHSSTITENSTGIDSRGNVILENSIIAGNAETNINAPNIEERGANLLSGDPMLSLLGGYGGLTATMPPLPGSPAIDVGSTTAETPETDQRGAPRSREDSMLDLGAAELGATVLVTTLDDAGAGSLRQVIEQAPPFARVHFDAVLDGGTLVLSGRPLIIDKDIFIDASMFGNGITVDANHESRVFQIEPQANPTLQRLTITHGTVQEGDDEAHGGGILNLGSLTIIESTIQDNTADERGGGIYSSGPLTLLNSAVVTNFTKVAGEVVPGDGIGIAERGAAFIGSSTIARNGTGIRHYGGSGLIVSYSTVSANAHGVTSIDGVLPIGSIIAGNAISNLDAEDTSTYEPRFVSGDPKLAPLGNYGGPTPTMPPLSGSPVINASHDHQFTPVKDQRGFPRIAGMLDIGAYETNVNINKFTGFPAWVIKNIAFNEDASFLGDADGNGISNGLEYATSGFIRPIQVTSIGGHSVIQFEYQPETAQDLVWRVMRSTDLRSFAEILRIEDGEAMVAPGISLERDPASYHLHDNMFNSNEAGTYYRLEVELKVP